MAKDMTYFFAAGKSLLGVEQFQKNLKSAGDAQAAFALEFGSTKWTVENFDDGGRMTGITFDTLQDPNLWLRYVKARDPQVFSPNKTSREGKELAKRMAALPAIPTDWQLIYQVMPPSDFKNHRVWDLENKSVYPRCQCEKIGTTWIIKVIHNGGTPPVVAPLDAKPVTANQFVELKGCI